MKIMVTGISGFIGRNLLPILLDEGHTVHGVNRYTVMLGDWQGDGNYSHTYVDLSNNKETKQLLKDIQPDCIVHLASHATTKLNENDPSSIIYDNIVTTYNIINYVPKDCKIIFASSMVVYKDFKQRRIETDECYPKSLYGMTKNASEQIINMYCDKPVILRLCAVVGPQNTLTHGLIYDVCKKLESTSKYLELLGDRPGSIKPFLGISTVLDVFKLFINNFNIHGTFNICPQNEISVEKVTNTVMDSIGIHKPIKWLGSKSVWHGDNQLLQCSNQKIRDYGYDISTTSTNAIMQALKIK